MASRFFDFLPAILTMSSKKTLPPTDTIGSPAAVAETFAGAPTDTTAWLSSLPLAAAAPAFARVPNELLVQFTEGAGAAGRAQALAAISGKSVEVLWHDGAGDDGAQLLRVKLTGNAGIDKAITMLAHQPGVQFAEANYIVGTQAISDDLQYTNGNLWGMHGDTSGRPYGTGADEAWAAGYTGSTQTVVGVIDTGVDYRHPDLYKNIWLNQGEISSTLRAGLTDADSDGLITFRDLNHVANASYVRDVNANGYIDAGDLLSDTRWEDGIDTDTNGYRDDLIGWDFVNNDNDPLDDNRHGTHVSGTIGGVGGNGAGVAGVNWSTQIMALKFLGSTGSGSTADALKALDYFTNMSKAAPAASDFVGTNNSWGGGGFSQSMLDAITRTGAAGNLFVAAAGNGGPDGVGDNNDTTASYPSNYSTQASLGWDAVVAVASMMSTGALSSFSNYGNLTVDLAAPGSSIMSTLPNGGYGTLSGTSMATPHVMGALALISSTLPGATPQECLDLLRQCVTYKADLAGKLAWDGWLDVGKLAALLAVDPGPAVSSLTMSDTSLNSSDTSSVTITFSAAVAGFAKEDVSLSSAVGTLGDFTTSDNLSWMSTLTPAAGVEAQGVKLSVAAGSYTSLDGTLAGQGFTSAAFAVDTRAPTVGVTLSDSQLTAGETARVSFAFSEVVSGFDSTDVTVSNGAIANLVSTDGRTWTASFTPAASTVAAVNSIGISAGVYADAAGNAGAAGTSANYTIDTTGPLFIYGSDGSDTLTGSAAEDVLNGVPFSSTRYGRGSIDVLTGSGSHDVFVLGTTGRVFYDDGASRNLGTSDYARITDFTARVDDLQLAAGRSYVYAMATLNTNSGLGIYWDINANGKLDTRSDEMIGMLVGVNTLDAADIVLV